MYKIAIYNIDNYVCTGLICANYVEDTVTTSVGCEEKVM